MATEEAEIRLAGSRIKVPRPYQKIRIRMYYYVDEKTLVDIKHFHIWPSQIIRAALNREIARRRGLEEAMDRKGKRGWMDK